MRSQCHIRLSIETAILLCVVPLGGSSAFAQGLGTPWDSLGRILEAPGAHVGGVHRYNYPRSDLTVRIGDVVIAPAVALVTWAGFATLGPDTIVYGDIVATAEELPAVLRLLAEGGLDVTAIHNHLVGETPEVMYVHYLGRGHPLQTARTLRSVLDRTATPLPVSPAKPRLVTIDTAQIFRALGARGSADGEVAKLSFALVPGDVRLGGYVLPLGTDSPVNLQRVSGSRVIATGDFAVLAEKVDGILDALAHHGIEATALHNHWVGESPTVYYMHFWADGPLADVLAGLRAALDAAR